MNWWMFFVAVMYGLGCFVTGALVYRKHADWFKARFGG